MQQGSLKPARGRSWKRLRRIAIVCELESHFIKDAEIARHLGLTVQALHHIKLCPEYQALKISKATGIQSIYETQHQQSDEDLREELAQMVPLAMGAVRTALQDKTNPNHIKVALDILDRTKATSKISRTELSAAPKINTDKQDEAAREFLRKLAGEADSEIVEADINIVHKSLGETIAKAESLSEDDLDSEETIH